MKRKKGKKVSYRNPVALAMATRTGNAAGRHGNRKYNVKKGYSRKAKHKGGLI
jgi:hypothetical protein